MKSRDETLEKFQQFCADVGQPLTSVSDGAKEHIANDFKKFARLKESDLRILRRTRHKKW